MEVVQDALGARATGSSGQGRCLIALDGLAESPGGLQRAQEAFAGLGAKSAVADTDALLVGAPRSSPSEYSR
jgi:hypothetical protein